MDEDTKKKLAEYAEKKKGRTNLTSLDTTLGGVALDNVQDRLGQLPRIHLHSDGILCFEVPFHGEQLAIDNDGCTAHFRWSYFSPKDKGRYNIPWVRFKYTAAWITAEMIKRFDHRFVRVSSYQGPNEEEKIETFPVFPVAIAVEFLRFIWTDPQEWGERARKYLHGYTEAYVQRFPGVGARVKITKHDARTVEWTGTVERFDHNNCVINLDTSRDKTSVITSIGKGFAEWEVLPPGGL